VLLESYGDAIKPFTGRIVLFIIAAEKGRRGGGKLTAFTAAAEGVNNSDTINSSTSVIFIRINWCF